MTHPALASRGTTFVQNDATPHERTTTQTAIPLQRRRVVDATPEALQRILNELSVDVHDATIGARSLPFNGPVVVLEAVPFANGVAKQIRHRLKTSRIVVVMGLPSLPTAGSPFASVKSIDDTYVTIVPGGTFAADLIFMVKP